MKILPPVVLAVLMTLALGAQVRAQLTLNDANASLFVNGKQPHVEDMMHHVVDINVTNVTFLDLHINSGPNPQSGVILIASPASIVAPVLSLGWGDTLDVGVPAPPPIYVTDATLVVDGVGLTVNPVIDMLAQTDNAGDLHIGISVSPFLASLNDPSVAFQSIAQDPTAPPFFFDATEAGDVSFFVGPLVTDYMLPDDGSVSPVLTVPICFGGSGSMGMFNIVNINSNGFVTFGAPSNDFTETIAEFFGGWGTTGSNPGVALAWSDLNPGGVNSGATYTVVEDPVTGSVECRFNNQVWFGTNTPAGSFSVLFNAMAIPSGMGDVLLDLSGLTPDPANTDDYIVGVTDGDSGVGTDTDLTDGSNTGFVNALLGGGYTSMGSPDSVGELFSSALGPPPPLIHFVSLGGFQWFIF